MNRWWPILGAIPVLAIALIAPGLGLALMGLLLLLALLVWLMTPSGRPCPRCGESVKKGVLDCPDCGFDFRTIGTGSTEPQR